MTPREKFMAIGLGALGGGLAAFLAWQFMKVQVAAQVTTTIDQQVPQQIDQQLAQLGITPATAADIRQVMQNLDQLGVFTTLAQVTTPHS